MAIAPRTYNETPTKIEDPGKSIAVQAKEMATNLVHNISSKTVVELTDMRDHLDTLMRVIKQREEKLIGDIESHAELAADVVGMKSIVHESLEQLIGRVSPVAVTVTHRNGGNGHD
jgi:hypothetical protein